MYLWYLSSAKHKTIDFLLHGWDSFKMSAREHTTICRLSFQTLWTP